MQCNFFNVDVNLSMTMCQCMFFFFPGIKQVTYRLQNMFIELKYPVVFMKEVNRSQIEGIGLKKVHLLQTFLIH